MAIGNILVREKVKITDLLLKEIFSMLQHEPATSIG